MRRSVKKTDQRGKDRALVIVLAAHKKLIEVARTDEDGRRTVYHRNNFAIKQCGNRTVRTLSITDLRERRVYRIFNPFLQIGNLKNFFIMNILNPGLKLSQRLGIDGSVQIAIADRPLAFYPCSKNIEL